MNQEEAALYEVYENSGLVYFKKGDFSNALADFKRAYEKKPNKGSAFNASLSAERLHRCQDVIGWMLAHREHEKDARFNAARALHAIVNSDQRLDMTFNMKLRKALWGNLQQLETLSLLRLIGDEEIVLQIMASLGDYEVDGLDATVDDITQIYQHYLTEPQAFGGNVLYQSCPRLGLPGVRLTSPRLQAYRINELVKPTHDVLDLGSNIGVISVEIARLARSVLGVEYSPSLNLVARKIAAIYRKKNINFVDSTIEAFLRSNNTRYDLVLACAITQWIDLPLIEAFELIARSVKDGGHVLFESNNLATHDKNFYANCDEIARSLGWSIQFKTQGYDDLFYNRAVVVFKAT